MNSDIFTIDNYNLFQDEEYYYFFRALNNGDLNDIESGITISNGKITKIRTDLDRYENIPLQYDNKPSLQEVYEHVRANHRKDTKFISLTSNANVSQLYGREYYQDRYVVVKISKKDFGDYVFNAGHYMVSEVQKKIINFINENPTSSEAYVIKKILECRTLEELNEIKPKLLIKEYEQGLTSESLGLIIEPLTTSVDYQELNDIQCLEKAKTIAMIDVLPINLLDRGNNESLIRTIDLAFSSLEQLHYGQIEGSKLQEIPLELMDLIAVVQQMGSSDQVIKAKNLIINYIKNGDFEKLDKFKYQDYYLDNYHNIEYFYEATNGLFPYAEARDLYYKSFYLVKSRLRAMHSALLLKKICNNENDYNAIIDSIYNATYGVEPYIFSKNNTKKLKVRENVFLDFCKYESGLLKYINSLDLVSLERLINDPQLVFSKIGNQINYIEKGYTDKLSYFAEAIIESFPWKKIGVKHFYGKKLLCEKLINSDCYNLYKSLCNQGIEESNVCQMLLTMVIRDVGLNDLVANDCFTITELERFLGYYKLENSNVELRDYQMAADIRIDEKFKTHDYTSLILPTGSGKSFVVLAQLLKRNNAKMLYLAPSDIILQQFKEYILNYVTGWADVSQKGIDGVIKDYFPNLKFATYHSLLSINQEQIIESQYDFIVFDELHRTGAPEWQLRILQILKNQKGKYKVLGVTATPLRDFDLVDMSDYWAKWFGYSDREISSHKHIALRMDLFDAIKLGYVNNIKIVSCDYNLQSGEVLENLEHQLDLIKDKNKHEALKIKFNKLRKFIASSGNVEQILSDYIQLGDKCIVFCPTITSKFKTTSNDYDNIYGEDAIAYFTDKLISVFGKDNVNILSMLGSRGKKVNRDSINLFNHLDGSKINFELVINMLNEGYHLVSVNKITWFRALDKNSFILYFQQIGRLVHAIDPNKPLRDDDIAVAIDLPNNTLEVVYNKSKNIKTDDLDMLNLITLWSLKNNRLPDINAVDRIEVQYAILLKRIQKKYLKYINEPEKLEKLDVKNKYYIEEIIKLGDNILLWTTNLSIKKREYIERCDKKIEPFELTGLVKDFCELRSEIVKEIGYLNFEEKLEEICKHPNYELVIKKNSLEYFSDSSSRIGKWICDNKEQILLVANNNFFAHKIALSKKWIRLRFDEYMEEIYLLSQGKKELIPRNNTSLKFSDGRNIGNWIRRHQEDIMKVSSSDEKAKLVAKARGWLNLTFEECLEEIYEISGGKKENIPITDSKIRFSDDSAAIGPWIYTYKERIVATATSNKYAKFIAFSKGWSSKTFNDYLDEIVYLFEQNTDKNNLFVQNGQRLRFSDNRYYIDLWVVDNKTLICENYFLHKGAKLICDYQKWNPLDFDQCLNECYDYLRYNPNINLRNSHESFKGTNIIIYEWVRLNKIRLKELASSNKKALYIVCRLKWLVLTFTQRLAEINEFLNANPLVKLTNADRVRFSDDSTYMSSWIYENKTKIIEESKYSDDAMRIVLLKGWLNIDNYLKEIYDICNGDTKKVRTVVANKHFSDGKVMVDWINHNKEKILDLVEINPYAKFVAKGKGWLNLTFEERLHEVAMYYLKNEGSIPEIVRFSDDSASMSSWISDNISLIKKMLPNNPDAIVIGRNRGWLNLSFDDRLREIFEYTGGDYNLVPVRGSLFIFSDGANMYNWISHNRDKLKQIMLLNPYAYFIAQSKKWINEESRDAKMEELILELQCKLNNGLITESSESPRTRK